MSMQIMDILTYLHSQGRTVVMVTHDPKTAEYAERIVIIKDGEIVDE